MRSRSVCEVSRRSSLLPARNRFGLTFMSAPYIPRLTKPSGKDTVFLTFSGSRSSSPFDEYATVPTDAERVGDFSAAGSPAIYDPTTLQQFTSNGTANVIPADRISPQATALLKYFPEPNLPGYRCRTITC